MDPSIAVASLGIGPDDLIKNLNTFELIFETLCIRNLRVYAESLNGNVYHYRDANDLECVAVIHLRNGAYGLIEDCGETIGLENIKRAFEIKNGEDYKMYSNWLGTENLDLNICDLKDLNFRLKKLPIIFKESYEYRLEPIERSIKLLEREYK